MAGGRVVILNPHPSELDDAADLVLRGTAAASANSWRADFRRLGCRRHPSIGAAIRWVRCAQQPTRLTPSRTSRAGRPRPAATADACGCATRPASRRWRSPRPAPP
jgi:hypothetical protein